MLDMAMLDFAKCLRENAHLLSLLSHYAQLGTEDRTIWQDRLMQMEGIDSKQMTVLHGELIAFDWIEQNTGHAVGRPDGTISGCYRITLNGLREFRRVHGIEAVVEKEETSEKAPPRIPRKKKAKSEPQAVETSESSKDSVAETLQVGSSDSAERLPMCDEQLRHTSNVEDGTPHDNYNETQQLTQ